MGAHRKDALNGNRLRLRFSFLSSLRTILTHIAVLDSTKPLAQHMDPSFLVKNLQQKIRSGVRKAG